MKQFIPFVIVYFIWDFVSQLIKVEGPFQVVHWIMLAMTVVFVVLLYFTGKDAIIDSKKKKEERAAELEKERKAQEARRRAMYIDDFESDAQDAEAAQDAAPDNAPDAIEADAVVVDEESERE